MSSPNLFHIVNFDKMMIKMLQIINGDNFIIPKICFLQSNLYIL